MDRSSIPQKVENLITPVLQDLDLELVEVQYRKEGKSWVLRIFIDKADHDGSVHVEDCSRVSHEVGDLIEVEELIPNHYVLEVSSPGLDRPLKTEKDFLRFRDRRIQVTTFSPIDKRRNFKGTIIDFKEGTLVLDAQGTAFNIPLKQIAKAKLEIEI